MAAPGFDFETRETRESAPPFYQLSAMRYPLLF